MNLLKAASSVIRKNLISNHHVKYIQKRSFGVSTIRDSKWAEESKEFPGSLTSTIPFEKLRGVTIPEQLRQNLHKWENAVAFECGVTGRKYTHGEVHKKANSFTASLQQAGLKQGDSICVLLPNIPEYPIVLIGGMDAGLLCSTINPAYTPDEISRQINDCQAKLIVTLPNFLPQVEAAKKQCPSLQSVVVIGDSADGCHSFFEMLKTDPKSAKILKGSEIDTADFAAILPYSSGTTGLPKGVEITHSTFTTNILQITHPKFCNSTFFENGNEQERQLAVLPYFHMYGLLMLIGVSMFQGTRTVTLPKFDPPLFINTIKELKPTTLHLVTPIINFMIGCNDITKNDLAHTKGVVAAAAPLGLTVINKFLEKVDRYILFQEGYGMTETSIAVTMIPPEVKNTKTGTSGTLCIGTTMKIVDVETGENVTMKGTPGEMCVTGPQIMKGYYKNEKATKDTFDSEGFLKTGDIGYLDKDHFLVIMDRIKELIKVKALQVAPGELENVLRSHPEVADVAVIGVKHEKLGEAPRAYIVPKTKTLSGKSVQEFMKDKVSSHKQLAGGVEFIEAIPKAASGKILRRVLSQQYKDKYPESSK